MNLPNDADLEKVSAWLQSLGLGDYADALCAHHVDEWVLARLNEDDLREIGVSSVGHRKRLMAAITQRFGSTGQALAPAAAPAGLPCRENPGFPPRPAPTP